MAVKTARATVELTKNDEGTWLNLEIAGRKASLSLNNSDHGPMIRDILCEWGESHFRPTGKAKTTLIVLGECLLAGLVTLILVGIDRRSRLPLLRPRRVDGRGFWTGHRRWLARRRGAVLQDDPQDALPPDCGKTVPVTFGPLDR